MTIYSLTNNFQSVESARISFQIHTESLVYYGKKLSEKKIFCRARKLIHPTLSAEDSLNWINLNFFSTF